MRRMWFALTVFVLAGEALGQTGGAPSGGAASSPGAAPSAPATRSLSPTGAPPTSAPNTSCISAFAGAANTCAEHCRDWPIGRHTVSGHGYPGSADGPRSQLPATASGGRPQPGGANSSEQSTRTGKNPISEGYADCLKLWDVETHMSKSDWSRACRQIENRSQNLQVEDLNTDLSGPKPRKPGAAAELQHDNAR